MLTIRPSMLRKIDQGSLRRPEPKPTVITTERVQRVEVPNNVNLSPLEQQVAALTGALNTLQAEVAALREAVKNPKPIITEIERDERGVAQRIISHRGGD